MRVAVTGIVALSEPDAALLISALIGLVGVIAAALITVGIPMWIQLRRNTRTLHRMDGKLEETRDAATTAAVQVQPNGGSSFHDRLMRRMDSLDLKVDGLGARLDVVEKNTKQ